RSVREVSLAGGGVLRANQWRGRLPGDPGRHSGRASEGEDVMTVTGAPRGRYHFAQVAQMEWIKLRSLRSTWWTLVITAAGAIAIAVAVGGSTENASGDLTNNALAGIVP